MVFGYPIYSIEKFFFKEGFTLKKVFCDSYSVSDSVLVTLAAAAAMSSDDKSTESMEITDIALNEKKIRKKAEAILSIRTDIPPLPSSVKCIHENAAVIWENCGSCVKLINAGKYHPKIILACFTNDKHEYFYRIQVGSANLTNSSAFETAVILEGTADAGEDNNSPNGSVLKEFYEMVFGSMKSKELFPNELQALGKTSFVAPTKPDDYIFRSEITNIRFAYTFPGQSSNNNSFSSALSMDASKYLELHVYSPFMKFDNGKQYLSTKVFNGQSKPAITYYTNLTQEIFDKKSRLANGW